MRSATRSRKVTSLQFSLSILMILAVGVLWIIIPPRGQTTMQQVEETTDLDIRSEVIAAINYSRKVIDLELADYRKPYSYYNLKSLTYETGGKPMRNLIVSSWRSGSSFLADILNSHPGNFYHTEPLAYRGAVQVSDEPEAIREAVILIRKLFNCDYTGLDNYLKFAEQAEWFFRYNKRLWKECVTHLDICWLPNFLEPFCRLFPFQSIKTVRLRLNLVEEILEDPDLNVRVVYLVRDPRGTMNSRSHPYWCAGHPDCDNPLLLCTDLVSDFQAASRLAVKHPHRFRVLRYEDLSVDPFTQVQELFNFFKLDYHPRVHEFLTTHTKRRVGGEYTTHRNTKSNAFQWRLKMTQSRVQVIQEACETAMDSWGYLPTFNISHQKKFNPIKHFKLT